MEEGEGAEVREGAQSRVESAKSSRHEEENVETTNEAELVEPEAEDESPPSSPIPPKPVPNALNLSWSFGVNSSVPVLNVSDENRQMVFYATAHTGVLYDFAQNTQSLLQGHCNSITCSCVSEDHRWIATADRGTNSMVIIWDSWTCIPVQTLFDAHPEGCVAVGMTPDAKYLVTLGSSLPQVVSIWDWTTESETPVCSVTLSGDYGLQKYVYFNPEDTTQLVSNSESQVVFYSWKGDALTYIAPPLTDRDFNKVVGLYSQSIFQPGSMKALTATSCGNIVVWEQVGTESACNKKAYKIVKVQEKGLSVLTTIDKYIVTGDMAGHIKFFDQQLRLSNWYKNINSGSINSVSFTYLTKQIDQSDPGKLRSYPASSTLEARPFVVNDMVIGTTSSNILFFSPNGSNLQSLRREHHLPIHAMACHPSQPRLCIGSYTGLLQLWDYEKKELLASRVFSENKVCQMIQCLSFNPTGDIIGVGFTNGCVRVIDGISLRDDGVGDGAAVFNHCHDSVTHIKFSYNSQYMATADLDRCVTLFKATDSEEQPEQPWIYLGKQRAHYKTIQDIEFGIALDSNEPRLLSLGRDRVLVEYDLFNSGVDDFRKKTTDRIEQSAVPLAFIWYPPIIKEDFFIIANDQYKLKLYNTTTKMCRKTLLGPTYGSPLRKMCVLPAPSPDVQTRYMAYITTDKIGLQILPLDGNPHKSMALIAHPEEVSNLVCSHDGKYLFTAGGQDSSVLMWSINIDALEAEARLGGEDLIPFYGLLEGGRDGELFAELEDYFYYAQLRSQGIEASDSRKTSVKIPLAQVPFVMRALGFYPSEQEVEDMINEVKFSDYVDNGQYVQDIDLGDFIKLYVNHRPAFGLSPMDLQKAFNKLGYAADEGFTIDRERLLSLLQNKGEHMTEGELAEYMSTLLGLSEPGGTAETGSFDATEAATMLREYLPTKITADSFATELLGFVTEEA